MGTSEVGLDVLRMMIWPKNYERQGEECGDLNEMSSTSLGHLNTWSLVGSCLKTRKFGVSGGGVSCEQALRVQSLRSQSALCLLFLDENMSLHRCSSCLSPCLHSSATDSNPLEL